MYDERSTARASNNISMPADTWEMVDFAVCQSGYKGRSDFMERAAEKQLHFQTKVGHMTDAFNSAFPEAKIDLDDMEDVTFRLPKGMKRILDRHCYNFGCDFAHQFGNIGVFKYLIMKEAYPELLDEYFRRMRNGEKSFFKAIII